MKTKKQQPALEQRVLEFIQEHHLVTSQQKLLVAVSGGKDSLSLLSFLKKIQKWAPVDYEVFAACTVFVAA